jgi:hypothetical protein
VRRSIHKRGTLRAALVEAATTLIAEKGVDALSVSELTRRLGVSGSAPTSTSPANKTCSPPWLPRRAVNSPSR